jgi:hypothetical protein
MDLVSIEYACFGEGISSLIPERMGTYFSYALGDVCTLLGFSGHPLFPKERCFEGAAANLKGNSTQLNHASVKRGVKRFHVATWWGVCSYRKLKLKKGDRIRRNVCPICGLLGC